MREFIAHLVFLALLTTTSNAQVEPSRVGKRSTPSGPLSGTITTIVETTDTVEDLKDLTQKSPLILQGIVTLELPSRCRTPENKPCLALETDFEFTTNKILKYDQPALKSSNSLKLDKVLVCQNGGKSGNYQVVTEGDMPLEVGEEYILFLTYDARPDLLRYEGYR